MKVFAEKVVYPGRALARPDDGVATFVDGLLPGETAEVRVYKNKKTFREAVAEKIVTPSPERITPRCASYGRCGGCSFQHASYETQIKLKSAYVAEQLAVVTQVKAPVIPSPNQWGYRNKMEFSFFAQNGRISAGLHEKNRFDRYFEVPPCFICDEDFLWVVERTVEFAGSSGLPVYDKRKKSGIFRHLVVRKAARTGEVLVNLVTNSREGLDRDYFAPLTEVLGKTVKSFWWSVNPSVSDVVSAREMVLLSGKADIEERLEVGGREYSFLISPFSFFQTNSLGAEKLYETVLDFMECRKNDRVLDLYCGTGTIGMTLAPYVGSVLGVEQVEQAVANALINKEKNGIENISFTAGTIEKWLKEDVCPEFNALVVDPPRTGLSSKVIDFIMGRKPEKIVYVSCNPSTLSRDLLELLKDGSYGIDRILPIDMFPQTFHVEVVVSLKRFKA
ncbi:MAG: 23S rRNA (uracil(1939)-C(5))-methyltransferase RlmD [Endomicrobiales bacterium]|nr:23S rRNA (uracil(1939)-C(5))-methyltransferase RlmD [Endomicrobiales bacterium]